MVEDTREGKNSSVCTHQELPDSRPDRSRPRPQMSRHPAGPAR